MYGIPVAADAIWTYNVKKKISSFCYRHDKLVALIKCLLGYSHAQFLKMFFTLLYDILCWS